MIIISLDEYGEFEKVKKKPVFISGIIFDSGEDQWEEMRERERINAYYKKAISEAGEGFRYPEDLHSNGDKLRDTSVIRVVKAKITETLPEFFRQGTYGGQQLSNEQGKKIQPRKGKYHIFVMLKSDAGKQNLLKENASMLAKDDYAANLYFHMATSVVNRLIFHNPIYSGKIPPVKIDIATRSSENVNNMDNKIKEQFKNQAYRINESTNSSYKYYSIMNSDIYRTIIAQEMINSGNTGVKIENIFVKSIKYEKGYRKMEFLYLSDSICSILSYQLIGESADDWLGQISDRVDQLNSDCENLVFGYDEIDNDFSAAWKQYEERNLYEALSIAFDAQNRKGKFAEYYAKKWFPYLEKRIKATLSPENFRKSIYTLSDSLVQNNLNQEKTLYILRQLEEMVDSVSPKYSSSDDKAAVLFKLYDAGLSAFCHIGNADKAMEYYNKCQEYASFVGMDAFLRISNKMAVCLEDSFEWDKALELAQDTLSNQELITDMKKSILPCEENREFLDEAKAISQVARIMAEKKKPEAEEKFLLALSKFEKDSANYKITQSYLLHFYADMGMKEEFEKQVTDYFNGRSTYNQRLKYICKGDNSAFSNKYAIYVLIRGLFCFGRSEIDENLWKKLCNLKETLEEISGEAQGGHPWEITYKYLEMIAIERKDKVAQEKFHTLRETCLNEKGHTIRAVEKFADAEVADFSNDFIHRDEITKELSEYMKAHFASIKELVFSQDGNERYHELEKFFTFMYR